MPTGEGREEHRDAQLPLRPRINADALPMNACPVLQNCVIIKTVLSDKSVFIDGRSVLKVG